MNNDLRRQIHNELNLRETEDLLEIWRGNDHVAWSEEAFEVIREILSQRGVDIPQQAEPICEYENDEAGEDDEDFDEEELAILDDENPPVFYEPFEVLRLTKQLDRMVRAMIVFIIAYNILNFSTSRDLARNFLIYFVDPDSVIIYLWGALIALLNAIIGVIIIYIPLKVLARLLRILMEMEFRSRNSGALMPPKT